MAWYPFGNLEYEIIGPVGPPGNGFKLTNDGNYDMENKILKNCSDPLDDYDATTKTYVSQEVEKNGLEIKDEIIKNNFNKFAKEMARKIRGLDLKIKKDLTDLQNELNKETFEKIKDLESKIDFNDNELKEKIRKDIEDSEVKRQIIKGRVDNFIKDTETKIKNEINEKIKDFESKIEFNDNEIKRNLEDTRKTIKDRVDNFIKDIEKKLDEIEDLEEKIKKDLDDKYLIIDSVINAKSKRIGNVADPIDDKNVVNKRYFENNALILKDGKFDFTNKRVINLVAPQESNDAATKSYVDIKTKINNKIANNILKRNNDGLYVPSGLIYKTSSYDAGAERISNLASPIHAKDAVNKEYVDKLDVANKNYVDKTIKINDKKPDNILSRDHDGLYVPSFMKNGLYNFENKRLINVANPILQTDAATKGYVEMIRNFYATIQEKSYRYEAGAGFKKINFSKFSSNLLDSNMKFTTNMDIKVTFYLKGSFSEVKPIVRFFMGSNKIHSAIMRVELDTIASVSFFDWGRKGDIFSIEILADGNLGDFNELKPYLQIEKIDYI